MSLRVGSVGLENIKTWETSGPDEGIIQDAGGSWRWTGA